MYRLYFHGPAYQVVGSAWKQGDGAASRFAADLPPQVDEPVLIGPRLVELCFQTVGLFEAGTDGRLALPLHVDAVRLNGSPQERAGLVATARPRRARRLQLHRARRRGTLVLRVDGYRTVPLPDPPPDDVVAPLRSVVGRWGALLELADQRIDDMPLGDRETDDRHVRSRLSVEHAQTDSCEQQRGTEQRTNCLIEAFTTACCTGCHTSDCRSLT